MRIPDTKIEDIRDSTDLVELVGEYVKLKRRGQNYIGLCPFHKEKTPSFNVNPERGFFHCFGCGAGGDHFQFVQRIENLGFIEAVRVLAQRAGIELPEEDETPNQSNEIESIYHALRFAARFFYEQMTQTETGQQRGLAYFEGRGFTLATCKKFGLGYAPTGWDTLIQFAEKQKVDLTYLKKAGLILPRNDGTGFYDRYRDRVIFPIFSHMGKVLGFGGRILEAKPDQPKYINSPETPVYHKSEALYGLFHAKQAIRKQGEAILVEGYTDVISLFQADVEHVVASSGTALTPQQIQKIGRYAKKIILLYDADSAGARAALRSIDLILAEGLAVYIVSLPDQADPDAFVQQFGGEAFVNYLQKHQVDFVQFKLQQAHRNHALDTPEGQAETMRQIVASIAQIPDELRRETYMRRASEVLGVPDAVLFRTLDELLRKQARQARRDAKRETRQAARRPQPDPTAQPVQAPIEALPAEKTLLRLMLQQGPPMIEHVLSRLGLPQFSAGPARDVAQLLLDMWQQQTFDQQHFLNGSLAPALQQMATEVLMEREDISDNWSRKQGISVTKPNETPYETANSAIQILQLTRVETAIATLQHRIDQTAAADLPPLLTDMQNLHTLRKQLQTGVLP